MKRFLDRPIATMGWRQLRSSNIARSTQEKWTKIFKLLFLAVPVVMIAAIILYLQKPLGLEVSEDTPVADEDNSQPSIATQIHLEQFDGRRTQWTLDAPRASNGMEDLIVVERPRLSMFRLNGEQINVTARQGMVDQVSRIMNFKGSVRAEGDGQFGLLTTEWLQFDPKKGILYTDREFHMQNKGSQLQGIGLTLFQETKKVYVPKKVKMKFIGGVPTLTGEQDS